MLKRKWITFISLLLMIMILTSCAKGAAHVKVNKNGSINIGMNLQMDARIQSLVGDKLDKALEPTLSVLGIEIKKSQSGEKIEYQLLKSYDSFQDLAATNIDLKGIKIDMEETDNLLYTKYDIVAQVDSKAYDTLMNQSIQTLDLPEKLTRFVLRKFKFDFSFTLPIDTFGDHNADKSEGSTLTWNISLTDPEPIRMEIYAPKIKIISIIATSVLLILLVGIIYWIKRRK
jgi:hypothetical protein